MSLKYKLPPFGTAPGNDAEEYTCFPSQPTKITVFNTLRGDGGEKLFHFPGGHAGFACPFLLRWTSGTERGSGLCQDRQRALQGGGYSYTDAHAAPSPPSSADTCLVEQFRALKKNKRHSTHTLFHILQPYFAKAGTVTQHALRA